ncbi:unnamed protein product [Miscanthus lutarioriparius]|uniref:H(+)/Pi cotransporter n=1 Tax=Miscanthus lutarioriparius TaxID=422564 RepID=A0A811RQQ6_9POAL|nr:unnamed protein product [Miscanthus lutarioriparius]
MVFFTDAYDLFCISLVTKLLDRVYYTDPTKPDPGTLPPNIAPAVNSVALCGTLVEQLFFGWLDDRLGQKSVYGMTLLLMVVCSLASVLSFGSTPAGVMATLCFCRFWLGFGIGGDYPLSTTIMSDRRDSASSPAASSRLHSRRCSAGRTMASCPPALGDMKGETRACTGR